MKRLTPVLLCFALVLAIAAPTLSESQETSLGARGEIYSVKAGLYGELFPQGSATEQDYRVLALDVVRPGDEAVRFLVPGTEADDLEGSAFVAYEESSDTAFLVWETRFNFIHSRLNLVAYRDGTFSDVIELVGSRFSFQHDPKFVITRDSYSVTLDDGGTIDSPRTILHLIYSQEEAEGDRVIYVPVILVGTAGWSLPAAGTDVRFGLDELDFSNGGVADVTPNLARATRIQAGENERTVVVGFANPVTGRLLTMVVDVVPKELSSLADEARAHIIHSGITLSEEGLAELADEVGDLILRSGADLHSGVVQFIADEARAHIIDSGGRSDTLESLASSARAHIIHSGVRITLRLPTEDTASAQIEIFEDGDISSASHTIEVRVAAEWVAPNTPPRPTTLYLSESGSHAIVAWDEANAVGYRESGEGRWSKIFTLTLGPELTRQQAHEILDQRVRSK